MRLSIQHLGKTYQDGKVALRDFNLDMDQGVFGLLGPNGAGKSTLLEILSLNLMPSEGCALWKGRDIETIPNEYRHALGYLPQVYGFYGNLRAEQMLAYLGSLHGLHGRVLRRRMAECLEIVGMGPFRRRKIKSYSGGMRQRLAIAQALLHDPELLVIDEPTTGLDPGERVAFRNMLFELGRSHLVFLSTHIVKDVEFSCQQMTLLYGGIQRFTGLPAEFMRGVAGRVFEAEMPIVGFDDFLKGHHVVAIQEHDDLVTVRFITRETPSNGAPDGIVGAAAVRPNLEDAYVDFIRQRREEESLVAAI